MIEYQLFAGSHDEVSRDASSVEIVYWTVREKDFLEIDEQLEAQFLGLA